MAFPINVRIEPVKTVGFAGISGTYAIVGVPTSNPGRQFFIQNLTDQTLMFSFGGINDHFPLPSNGFFLSDITSNEITTDGFFLQQGAALYVKDLGVAPTSGSVYFTVIFGGGPSGS